MNKDSTMKCIICDSKSHYYFSKTYSEPPFDTFMKEIGTVDYHQCEHCGFVLSKTHSELPDAQWNNLNHHFHHYMENPETQKNINQPPYAEQAMMLIFLGKAGLIDLNDMIDYAAGYGTLSHLLLKYHNRELPIFDPHIREAHSNRYIERTDLKTYKTVINSAMFEHVLKREDLDQLNHLVDTDGCLILHTLVCEKVPRDPMWFYLVPPVHTAFHTNKSMEILMEQWGYRSSVYCPQSKCWVLFKVPVNEYEEKIKSLNQELQTNWFYCKTGFMDYWKG